MLLSPIVCFVIKNDKDMHFANKISGALNIDSYIFYSFIQPTH